MTFRNSFGGHMELLWEGESQHNSHEFLLFGQKCGAGSAKVSLIFRSRFLGDTFGLHGKGGRSRYLLWTLFSSQIFRYKVCSSDRLLFQSLFLIINYLSCIQRFNIPTGFCVVKILKMQLALLRQGGNQSNWLALGCLGKSVFSHKCAES